MFCESAWSWGIAVDTDGADEQEPSYTGFTRGYSKGKTAMDIDTPELGQWHNACFMSYMSASPEVDYAIAPGYDLAPIGVRTKFAGEEWHFRTGLKWSVIRRPQIKFA